MNNNYENKILDAIQTLVDTAVSRAGYDKTIKAVISKCVNQNTGKYVVKYQDSSFYAYSNDLDSVYSGGTPVYVLVPGNDMSQTKTILGSVDKLGTEYINLSESSSAYQEVGTSIVTPNGTIPGISSYKSGGDSLVIYNRTASSGNTVNVDTEGAEIYFQNAQYIEIGGTFTTRLNEEQKRRGNYGLVFDISFKDGEEEVHKNYVIDINSMTGNPYSYNYGSAQIAIFQIDGANFYRLNSITLECKNFPHSATPANADIFVEDIVLKALTPLTRDEIANNSLTFITKQGIYFNTDDSADATRLIETEVKINKKVVPNTGGLLRFYWFKEDSTVGITSPDYLPFGGPGWKCINTYNVIDETNDIRDYITDVDTLTVVKSGNPAKENEYKCVVIYNDEIQVERNIIIYNQASEYTITIESDQGNYFKYNEGNPTLTCSVNPTGTYTYIWTETNSANRTEVLTETSNTYSVQLSNIANFSKFTCSVYSSGNFVGKSDIVITNSWDSEDNSYALVMENSDQIFKYNEKGIAPTNKSLEKPIALKPLQFVLYDEMGHQVDDNKILSTDVFWYVPKEDTMIKVSDSGITPTEEDGYLVYNGLKTLNFTIASIYNIKKLNNTIKLVVKYNDRVLNTVSELEFIKEGEIGSNGTDFVCRIVPNVASGGVVPTYPIFTANMSTNPVIGDMNYNRPSGQSDKWFKVQLYKDGVQIYEGVASGTSEENKSVAIEWSMLKNRYTSSIVDSSSFTVNSSTGAFTYVDLDDDLDRAANLVKVTVSYDGATYYATMPIILVQAINANGNTYTMDLVENTGFRYVMYSTDGLNPLYDSSNPFALKAYRGTTDITNDNSITFTYSTLGQIYNGTTWVNENNFIAKTHGASNPLAKNEADYRPIEKFNGLSVNNAVKCIVKDNNVEIVRAYLPIHFYLNRFGNAALNGWDGNHIEINNNGGFILAPQVGAGKKESDNSYTGIFMGNVREAGSSVDEVGLYGYYKGTRTIALDTKDGSARFGKQGAGQIVIDPATADYSGKGTARLYSNDYSITYTTPSAMVPAQTKYTAGFSYWRKVSSTEYRLLREGTDYTIGNTIANTDYVWNGGAGLEIDLNDPHIRFGSGKFRVDSDGQVYATGFVTVNNLENGDYNIPSASIDVGGGDNLNDYMSATQNTLENLQSQIDGEIQFWNGPDKPLPNSEFSDWSYANYPAVAWTTEDQRIAHQADIYTVIEDVQGELKQGKGYRFDKVELSPGTEKWVWVEITDQEMSAVQALAESKAKVFIKDNSHPNPTPPYSVGDIWLADGDMYTCINAKDNTGSYAAADWELATDYTDDSAVNTLKQNVISSSEVQYALGDDATTAPTTGWSASTPTWTTGKYVWQRTVVTYADSTQTVPHTDISDPVCIQGAKGEPGSGGRGIDSTEVKYQVSNSGTTAPTGTWQTNVPSISPGQFLWTRTVITYTDGLNPTTSYSVSYDGTNGTNGTSITITTQNVTYAESTSGTTAPTTGWQSSIPAVDDGKFLWTKTYVKYSDNTETTSYSVSYQSPDGFSIWTTTTAPSNNTYTRSQLTGPTDTQKPRVGEAILRSNRYQYPITAVSSDGQTITVGTAVDLKGSTGTSATNVVCGNEAQIISCDKDGKVEADTTITIPFAGYTGSSRKACTVAVTDLPTGITVTSNTSATTSADGSLVLTAAAASTLGGNSNGTITLTFSCNSLTFIKKFAWSKAIKGADGVNGKSIVVDTTTLSYQNSTSGTTIPTGTWTSSPSPEEGKYLWTRTVTTYKLEGTSTSAGSATSYAVAYVGTNGDDARSLVSVTPLYYLKSNDTAPAAPSSHVTSTSTDPGVWTTVVPSYISGYTYFTCYENEFDKAPLYEWTSVIKDNGINEALVVANEAKDAIDELQDDIDNPTDEKTGKSIDINDALSAPMIDFKMYGDTQQDSTTQGKNFCPTQVDAWEQGTISDGVNSSSTTRIRTKTYYPINSDTNYHISIQDTTYRFLNIVLYDKNKEYINTYYGINSSINGTYSMNINIPSNYQDKETKYMRVLLRRNDSGDILSSDVTSAKPQIELGTAGTTWEEFTPNSPSPDYPQEVKTVTGRNDIQVTGKNLYPQDYLNGSGTQSDVNFTVNNDNSISANGTANSLIQRNLYGSVNSPAPCFLENGTYIMTGGINSNQKVTLRISRGSSNSYVDVDGTPKTFTIDSQVTGFWIYLNIASGQSVNGTFKPMIRLSTITDDTYEPYIGQNYEINLGKNLFDKDNTPLVNLYVDTNTNKFGNSNDAHATYIGIQPNTTYTISKNAGQAFRVATSSQQPANNVSILSTIANHTGTSITITTEATAKYLFIHYFNTGDTGTASEMKASIQVEKGSQATSFSPYFEPIELCKIEDYQDYIYKDNGSWYIHKEINKFNMEDLSPYIHNATYWQSNFNAENSIMSIRVGKSNFSQLNILDIANRWKSTSFTYGGGWNNLNQLYKFNNIDGLIFGVLYTDIGLSAWTTSSSTETTNAIISGLNTYFGNTDFYLPLATPTNTIITNTELIGQLNNLMSTPLFENINHITCETVNEQPYLYIKYYRNTAINNNFASKEDLNSVENTANAAYSQAQSTTIVYTTTATANTPGESAVWTESLPVQTDKYIWQKTIYRYLDSSKNYQSVPTCIYSPTSVTNQLEYCLCSQNNYDDTKITDAWQSESFPWDDSYYTSAGVGNITILRYQFVRNKYTDTNKETDNVTYSTPVLDQAWYMFGYKLAAESLERQLLSSNINNNIITMDSQNGLIVRGQYAREGEVSKWYGIRLTSFGIQFLTEGLTDWGDLSDDKWKKVWNIDGTLDTEYITVINLNADNILSGTLTLDTADNNGSFVLRNINGNTTINGNGIAVNSTGSNTYVQLKNNAGGITAVANNVEYFGTKPDTKTTTMDNAVVKNDFSFNTNIKIVHVTNGIAFIGI